MADRFEPPSPPTARPFLEFRPLLRAVGIASDAKKLILASLGLVAIMAGWNLIGSVVGDPNSKIDLMDAGSGIEIRISPESAALGMVPWLVTEPFRMVVSPFIALFKPGSGPGGWSRSALMAVWAVAVWGIFGGAIARIAVVQATSERQIGLGTAVRFSLGKAASFIGAPLTPMIAVAFFAACCGLFGLIHRIPGIGPAMASALGFVPLLFGLMMALILAGLAIGWPLMHATVAAEGEDAPDALSRSYSYVNQRFPRYVAHVVVAWIIGAIGFAFVILFARAVLALAGWGVAWGAPDPMSSSPFSESARAFWVQVVGWIVHGWIYSYFWSSASIIYLILRRDVDGTIWHDVYLPEHESDLFAAEAATEAPRPVEAEV